MVAVLAVVGGEKRSGLRAVQQTDLSAQQVEPRHDLLLHRSFGVPPLISVPEDDHQIQLIGDLRGQGGPVFQKFVREGVLSS